MSVYSFFSLKNPELCLFTDLYQTDLPNHLHLINILAWFHSDYPPLYPTHVHLHANTLSWWLRPLAKQHVNGKHQDFYIFCFSIQIISFEIMMNGTEIQLSGPFKLVILSMAPSPAKLQVKISKSNSPRILHQFTVDSASVYFWNGAHSSPLPENPSTLDQ